MTREEIMQLEGRELDAHVAEIVMGLEPGTSLLGGWSPSTDIAAAWEVMEKPEIMDRLQIGVYPTSFGKWIAKKFMPGGKDCTVQADTAPLAICRCVLLAVMEVNR